jgi:hypothetical protein
MAVDTDSRVDNLHSAARWAEEDVPSRATVAIAMTTLAGLSVAVLLPITAGLTHMVFSDLRPAGLLTVATIATVVLALILSRMIQDPAVRFFDVMIHGSPRSSRSSGPAADRAARLRRITQ